MDLKEKQLITQQLNEYVASTGVPLKTIGKLSEVKTYVNYIAKGKYEVPNAKGVTEISDSIFNKVSHFLKGEVVIRSTNLIEAFDCFRQAKMFADFNLLTGAPGRGKTFSAKQYQKENPKNTFVLTSHGNMTNRDFVKTVARLLGVGEEGTVSKVLNKIIARFKSLDDSLLIIDESENLRIDVYLTIKLFVDELKHICGIVLIGANKKGRSYADWLEDMAMAERGNFPQLLSRLSLEHTELQDMTYKDFEQLADHYELKDVKKRKEIYTKARGGYRLAVRTLQKLQRKMTYTNG
ncbi:ATP-binding protein [Flammeovirga aprica]|uniref:ATP-binding protein n=1 Tax=Flammeovirga aprica JL-4 TaxID=694437 RepID=A0A7X9RUN4_9BACT|nr:ATP-binding protein [Flammeovirga aprica]NME69035.1 ATP-binding protein [Flammeovirga aprica JL-4]